MLRLVVSQVLVEHLLVAAEAVDLETTDVHEDLPAGLFGHGVEVGDQIGGETPVLDVVLGDEHVRRGSRRKLCAKLLDCR